jgi:hypothetical protein
MHALEAAMSDFYHGDGVGIDTGCHIAPACLSCYLPVCIEDNPQLLRRLNREERDRKVLERFINYAGSIDDLAVEMKCAPRTIYRILARAGTKAGHLLKVE